MLAIFTTDTQSYLLLINNWAKIDDVKHQMNSELELNV